MKIQTVVIVFLLVGCFSVSSTMAQDGHKRSEADTTRSEVDKYRHMIDNAKEEVKKAQNDLNNAYKNVLRVYAADSVFIKALKKSQLEWNSFERSYMKSVFPEGPDAYGEIYPECRSEFLLPLLNFREAQLQTWLTGISDSVACHGSIKSYETLQKSKINK